MAARSTSPPDVKQIFTPYIQIKISIAKGALEGIACIFVRQHPVVGLDKNGASVIKPVEVMRKEVFFEAFDIYFDD